VPQRWPAPLLAAMPLDPGADGLLVSPEPLRDDNPWAVPQTRAGIGESSAWGRAGAESGKG